MYKKNIDGILLLDKPKGISSNNILQKIKNFFCVPKAGYIGTLDPLATGVLPICFGACTKFSEYFIEKKKLYRTVAKFGQITTTYDSEGIVLEERKVSFSVYDLLTALKKLKGCITQNIPAFSAKKYKGNPLYKYARKNIFISPIKKQVYVYQLHCIKYNNQFIELEILCSKGTYIRTLIHDLGKLLKCGAHVISLRRIKFFSYSISDTITFTALKNINNVYSIYSSKNIFLKFFLPIKKIFFQLPEIIFSSYFTLNNKKNISLILKYNPGVYRITIKNNNDIFIIGKINENNQLISYKRINIS